MNYKYIFLLLFIGCTQKYELYKVTDVTHGVWYETENKPQSNYKGYSFYDRNTHEMRTIEGSILIERIR